MMLSASPRTLARCFATLKIGGQRRTSAFLPRPVLRVSVSKRFFASSAGTTAEQQTVLSDEEKNAQMDRFYKQQGEVKSLTHAEEARTLIQINTFGTLSTVGLKGEGAGFPTGSFVQYASDAEGRPVFAFSSLSTHMQDIESDPRCSLTVTSPTFKNLGDARFTLVGSASPVAAGEVAAVREMFLLQHPDSYWVDFGDFAWFRLDPIVNGRLVGGFGRIKTMSGAEYSSASADPVAAFSAVVAEHMNADHSESTVAMVRHFLDLPVSAAEIVDLDQYAMNLIVELEGEKMKARLPFPRPAVSRADIKTLIVECTRAAAGKKTVEK